MANTREEQLASNAILFTMAKVLASFSMMAFFVVISHLFTVNQYGEFRLLWLFNKTLIVDVFSLGIPLSIFYFIGKISLNSKRWFLLQSFLILLALGVIFGGLAFLLSGQLSSFYGDAKLAQLFKLLALFPAFFLPTLILEGTLVSENRPRTLAVYVIVDRLMFLALCTLSVYAFRSVQALCITIVFYSLIELFSVSAILVSATNKYPLLDRSVTLTQQLKYSIPVGLSSIVQILSVELDKLIVSSFFSISKFATYVNGAFEVPLIGTIGNAISTALMPEYVSAYQRRDFDSILRLWHGSIVKVSLIFYPLMFFLAIYSEEFITLLFSEKYVLSAPIFEVYLLALIPKVTWYSVIVLAAGKSTETLIASCIALACNAGLSIILVNYFGMLGAAYATVFTAFITAGYYLARISRLLSTSFQSVFPWSSLTKVLAISGLFSAILYFLKHSSGSHHPLLQLTVASALFFPSIVIVFRMANLISREDIDFIKRWFATR